MDPISIGLMAGGLGAQVFGMITGNSAQQKLMQTQLAQERMIAARDRLAQVRQLRAATAAVTQAGENQGVGTSSGIAGGKASVYGQVGQNIGFINNQEMYGMKQTSERGDIAQAQGVSQIGEDIFNIGAKYAQGGF